METHLAFVGLISVMSLPQRVEIKRFSANGALKAAVYQPSAQLIHGTMAHLLQKTMDQRLRSTATQLRQCKGMLVDERWILRPPFVWNRLLILSQRLRIKSQVATREP